MRGGDKHHRCLQLPSKPERALPGVDVRWPVGSNCGPAGPPKEVGDQLVAATHCTGQ